MKDIVINLHKGLLGLHSKDIIHNNLKLTNIFVDFENQYRIGDLGADFSSKPKISEEYLSPELLSISKNTSKSFTNINYKQSEAFSLGAILLQIATCLRNSSDLLCLQMKQSQDFNARDNLLSKIKQLYGSKFEGIIRDLIQHDLQKRKGLDMIRSDIRQYVEEVESEFNNQQKNQEAPLLSIQETIKQLFEQILIVVRERNLQLESYLERFYYNRSQFNISRRGFQDMVEDLRLYQKFSYDQIMAVFRELDPLNNDRIDLSRLLAMQRDQQNQNPYNNNYNNNNNEQQRVLNLMKQILQSIQQKNISPEQLNSNFLQQDKFQDRYIPQQKFLQVFYEFGIYFNNQREDVQTIMDNFRVGNSDNINYVQFMANLESSKKTLERDQGTNINTIFKQIYQEIKAKYNNIQSFLNKYDRDKNQLISEQEFLSMMSDLNLQLNSKLLVDVYQALEPDSKKNIYFYNFQKAFKQYIDEDFLNVVRLFIKDLIYNNVSLIQLIRQFTTDPNFIAHNKLILAFDSKRILIKVQDLDFMLEELGCPKSLTNNEVNYVRLNEQLLMFCKQNNVEYQNQFLNSLYTPDQTNYNQNQGNNYTQGNNNALNNQSSFEQQQQSKYQNKQLAIIMEQLKNIVKKNFKPYEILKLFQSYDITNSKAMNHDEFKKAVITINQSLSDLDVRTIFYHFSNNSNTIKYEVFLEDLDPSITRQLSENKNTNVLTYQQQLKYRDLIENIIRQLGIVNRSVENLFFSSNGTMSQIEFRLKLRDDLRLQIDNQLHNDFIDDLIDRNNGQIDTDKFIKIINYYIDQQRANQLQQKSKLVMSEQEKKDVNELLGQITKQMKFYNRSFKDIFGRYDPDQRGYVETRFLPDALSQSLSITFNIHLQKTFLAFVQQLCGTANNNIEFIDLNLFVKLLNEHEQATQIILALQNQISVQRVDVEQMFKRMDSNNQGYLNQEQFKDFVRQIDSRLSELDLLVLYKKFDINNDNKISFSEVLCLKQNQTDNSQPVSQFISDISLKLQEQNFSFEQVFGSYQYVQNISVNDIYKNLKQIGYDTYANDASMRKAIDFLTNNRQTDYVDLKQFSSFYEKYKINLKFAIGDNPIKDKTKVIKGIISDIHQALNRSNKTIQQLLQPFDTKNYGYIYEKDIQDILQIDVQVTNNNDISTFVKHIAELSQSQRRSLKDVFIAEVSQGMPEQQNPQLLQSQFNQSLYDSMDNFNKTTQSQFQNTQNNFGNSNKNNNNYYNNNTPQHTPIHNNNTPNNNQAYNHNQQNQNQNPYGQQNSFDNKPNPSYGQNQNQIYNQNMNLNLSQNIEKSLKDIIIIISHQNQQLRTIFEKMDFKESRILNIEQIKTVLKQVGIPKCSKHEINQIAQITLSNVSLNEINYAALIDGCMQFNHGQRLGQVPQDVLLNIILQNIKNTLNQKNLDLNGIFRPFLNGQNNLVYPRDIMDAMKQIGLSLSPQDMECLFMKLKKNELNQVNYLELNQLLTDNLKTELNDTIDDWGFQKQNSLNSNYKKDEFTRQNSYNGTLGNNSSDEIKRLIKQHISQKEIPLLTFFRQMNSQSDDQLTFNQLKQGLLKRVFNNDQYLMEQRMNFEDLVQFFKNIPKKNKEFVTSIEFKNAVMDLKEVSVQPLIKQIRQQLFWNEMDYKDDKKIKDLFRRIDINGDGEISFKEFSDTIKQLGIQLSEEEIQNVFYYFDKEGHHSINYDKFITVLKEDYKNTSEITNRINGIIQKDGIDHQIFFNKFDPNRQGYISRAQFDIMLKRIQFDIGEEEAEEMFEMFDVNKKYQISYEDFINFLKNNSQKSQPHDITPFINQLRREFYNNNALISDELFRKSIQGRMTSHEFKREFMRYSKLDPSQLDQVFAKYALGDYIDLRMFLDKINMIEVDLTDFKQAINHALKDLSSKGINDVSQLFGLYAKLRPGYLNKNEFEQLLLFMRIILSAQELNEYFQAFDQDSDTYISLFEFQNNLKVNQLVKRQNSNLYGKVGDTLPYNGYQPPTQQIPPYNSGTGNQHIPTFGVQAGYNKENQSQNVPTFGGGYNNNISPFNQDDRKYNDSMLLAQDLVQYANNQKIDLFDLFFKYDSQRNGVLTKFDVQTIIQQSGLIVNDYQIDSFIKQFTDNNSNQQFNILLFLVKNMKPVPLFQKIIQYIVKNLNQNFDQFLRNTEKDKDGNLNLRQFKLIFSSLRLYQFEDYNIQTIFDHLDLRKRGLVNYLDISNLVKEQVYTGQNPQTNLYNDTNTFNQQDPTFGYPQNNNQVQQRLSAQDILQRHNNILRLIKQQMDLYRVNTQQLFRIQGPLSSIQKNQCYSAFVNLKFSESDPELYNLIQNIYDLQDQSKVDLLLFDQLIQAVGTSTQVNNPSYGQGQQIQHPQSQIAQGTSYNNNNGSNQPIIQQQQDYQQQLSQFMREDVQTILQLLSDKINDEDLFQHFSKYDVNNTGFITHQQFKIALYEEIGLDTMEQLTIIENHIVRNGQVNLMEMIEVLKIRNLGYKGDQQSSIQAEQFGISNKKGTIRQFNKQEIEQILKYVEQIKSVFKQKGKNEYEVADYYYPPGDTILLDLQAFSNKTKVIQSGLNEQQIKDLFTYLDINGQGTISINEFKYVFEKDLAMREKNPDNIQIDNKTDQEIVKMFKEIDIDGSGEISRTELFNGLRQIGINPSQEELDNYIRMFDKDNSGTISLDEFKYIFKEKIKNEMMQMDQLIGQIKQEFKKIDDGTRTLNKQQLNQLFINLGIELNPQDLDAIYKEIDMDGSNSIDIDELIFFMTKNQSGMSQQAAGALMQIRSTQSLSLVEMKDVFNCMPKNFTISFLRNLNKVSQNLPSSSLKPKLDQCGLFYNDIMLSFKNQNNIRDDNILQPIPSQLLVEFKFQMATGVPIPNKANVSRNDIIHRQIKVCLFDKGANHFIGNTCFINATWKDEYEDRWYFENPKQTTQGNELPIITDHNKILLRLNEYDDNNTNLQLIFEFVIYFYRNKKQIELSNGFSHIDLVNLVAKAQKSTSFEERISIEGGQPNKQIQIKSDDIRTSRQGFSAVVKKLSKDIMSQLQLQVNVMQQPKKALQKNQFTTEAEMLPANIICNRYAFDLLKTYRQFLAQRTNLNGQINLNMNSDFKVKTFLKTVDALDIFMECCRLWNDLKSKKPLKFSKTLDIFEYLVDQLFILYSDTKFKYNHTDPSNVEYNNLELRKHRKQQLQEIFNNLQKIANDQMDQISNFNKNNEGSSLPFSLQEINDDEEEENIVLEQIRKKAFKQSMMRYN